MSTRFLLCALALGVGAVTACSGATDSGLFAPDGETSGGGSDSGSVRPDSGSTSGDSGGSGMDAAMAQPDGSTPLQDANTPQPDTSPPPHLDSGPPPDPGVDCPGAQGMHCSVPSESCCVSGLGTTTSPTSMCAQAGQCDFESVEVPCDNTAECDEIAPGQGQVCCVTTDDNGIATSVGCADPSDCTGQTSAIACDPNVPSTCATGTTCRASTRTLPGYYLCLSP